MARILIVGCGCRGQRLAACLVGEGHAVRGTTRSPDRLAAIESAGAEAVLGDPDRLGTLLPALAGVSAVCWLMGSAVGPPEAVEALHGPRLRSMLEALVDSPVRGLVYEAAGPLAPELYEEGAAIASDLALTHRMPLRVVDRPPPADPGEWITAMRVAVEGLLSD